MSGYYYATPIGRGMSNLAGAIAGGRSQAAQAGLLQARQELVDQQALTEEAQRAAQVQLGNVRRAQARAKEQEIQGATDLGSVFLGMQNAPLKVDTELVNQAYGQLPVPAAPEPMAADYGLGPAPAAPADGLAGAVAPYVPSVPVVPRTRQEMAAEAYAAASRAGPQMLWALPKAMLGYGGAMDATAPDPAAPPYGPERLTSFAVGAGEPFSQTPVGAREHEARLAAEAKARDETTRAGQKLAAQTNIQRENIREEGKVERGVGTGRGRGGKPPKTTDAQEKQLDKDLENYLLDSNVKSTPQQRQKWIADVRDRVANGERFLDAKIEVMSGLLEEDQPAQKRWFGKDKPATMRLRTDGSAAPAAAPTAPKPAAAVSAPKAIDQAKANDVKARMKRGEITREQAVKELQAMGFK